ncbi:MAG TPA: glutamyl-tRNA reductase [Phycisphaerae bacterium]|nr:glutamyl-tRNA reductase [Phycisphaerae bacterium]HRY66677.1 glutamyl-tRNA reductase [Phycisphaerae bacterium]HSA27620.1 glutamyl-tRNA reductase [Phycisphaerae bacterium]
MRTLVIGCNHRSAPVELRERLAFGEADLPAFLAALKAEYPHAEAVLISTCNRIELYVSTPVYNHPRIGEAIAFLVGFKGLEVPEFAEAFYSYEDAEAVRHLFRVVSSLDSMVLGESQILGQSKQAFEIARRAGTAGTTLGELFQRAFSVAKDAHTRTAIATGRISVGSAAVDLARQIFSRLDDKTIFMVGAGKMGEVTLNHLMATRPNALWVTNRTDQRAVELSERIRRRHAVDALVVPWSEWVDRLADVDVVISSTGSRDPILTAAAFEPIPKRRRYRSLLLIDIAVPRDIDPEVGRHDSVYLFNIDDLQMVTEATLIQRREAINRCHEIIEANVVAFLESKAGRDLGPLIQALREHFKDISDAELAWASPKFEHLSEADRKLVEQLLHRVIQKILHDPLQLLGEGPPDGARRVYADALRTLFHLDKEGV